MVSSIHKFDSKTVFNARLYREPYKMKYAETKLLQQLADKLAALSADMLALESTLLDGSLSLHKNHLRSARNLTHYLALRQHDLRDLQTKLAVLGLSSLGRSESHVLSSIQTVHHALRALLGSEDIESEDTHCLLTEPPVKFGEGSGLLSKNAAALLGRKPLGRRVRIMVTMPTEASTDYELVRDLLRSGMDCMRINCAHDNPTIWLGMIQNLKRAQKEVGRPCRIEMDLAGPKLRTGPIEPGPAVIRCRPERDIFGRVITPARIWLTSSSKQVGGPLERTPSLLVEEPFLEKVRQRDVIHFRDARGARRSLQVVKVARAGCWTVTSKTAYFVPGIEIRAVPGNASRRKETSRTGHVGPIPSTSQKLLLKQGETLILTRSTQPGKPARLDKAGRVTFPAQIGVTLPHFFDHAKDGEPILFDDGKIGGIIRSVNPDSVRVEITQVRLEGEYLGEGKGINLPDTRIDTAALTEDDVKHLEFIAEHADLLGYSFVRTEDDVRQLIAHLRALKKESLGIVLKIETREAFDNLPRMILSAMAMRSVGVMIARGDLAVECGYQRLAEIQEEILWICEAAHLPVIWATQVLESLAKNGIPSRSEITDAAMGERAECVMLNKGPHVVEAVKALDDILRRMQDHQDKKRSMLRRLRVADSRPTPRMSNATVLGIDKRSLLEFGARSSVA